MNSDALAIAKLRQLHRQHTENLARGVARVRIEDWLRATHLDEAAFTNSLERLEAGGMIKREFSYARPA